MQQHPFANKHVPVVLGASVLDTAEVSSDGGRQGCVTMRYDFKPASVDYSRGSVVKSEAGEARLAHSYKGGQAQDAVFRGTAAAGAASDYVLIFDGEKFVVERLVENVGALKHLRSADVAGHDNGPGNKRTRNPRAAIVAAAKKQRKKEAASAAASAANVAANAAANAATNATTATAAVETAQPLSEATDTTDAAELSTPQQEES